MKSQFLIGLAAAFGVVAAGVLVQGLIDFNPIYWAFPLNVLVAFLVIAFVLLLRFGYAKSKLYAKLTSIPRVLATLSVLILLLILLGIVPQLPTALEPVDSFEWFLLRMTHSLGFIGLMLYVVISLGLIILKREASLSGRYVSFMSNHLGLWLVLFAGLFGAADASNSLYKVLWMPLVYIGLWLMGAGAILLFGIRAPKITKND